MIQEAPTKPEIDEAGTASSAERMEFRYHPRLIRALGAELVTNDIIAVIELVKNSYDAFAHNVKVRFAEDSDGDFIEILDDGSGMTRDVITEAWFTVATPFKADNPTTRLGARQRRVSGDKGLGRLSAARLGNRLEMITQASGAPCWKVDVEWDSALDNTSSGETKATISEVHRRAFFPETGTRIRISDLSRRWADSAFNDLRDSLARLVSPFKMNDEFNITLKTNSSLLSDEVSIESPKFLSDPPYQIVGTVDTFGNVKAGYAHSDSGRVARRSHVNLTWSQIYDAPNKPSKLEHSSRSQSECGPFEFEIRAWDLNPEERSAIAERYEMKAREIQRLVNSNKGVALYRDGILVLPKTDHAKDWLGLDERRIRRVGPRIGTRNVIGYVNIRADNNVDIRDTSDREALASNTATDEFRCILMAIVSRFETERNRDREPVMPTRLKDVFRDVSAESVLRRVRALARRGAPASEMVRPIERHSRRIDQTREVLRHRFVYYSRVAALGQMAHMLVHEVRNRTTSIGSLLRQVASMVQHSREDSIERSFQLAEGSVKALESLADKLGPLASRSFKRKGNAVVEEQITNCIDLLADSVKAAQILCKIPKSETRVAIDPGELTLVVYNLLDNAAYWLGVNGGAERTVEFGIHRLPGRDFAIVSVGDNGPGIDEADEKRVFLPGFTKKPHGTGMGLTVASELVAAWGGEMRLKQTTRQEGATFVFDVPLVSDRRS